MLLLTFHAGQGLYAIEARHVVEVIPRVPLRHVPQAPASLAGLLWYRSSVVPVIEFGLLIGELEAPEVLSTRIILARSRPAVIDEGAGSLPLVGLIAARVNRVVPCRPEDLVLESIDLPAAPFLGGIVQTAEGLVQLVEPAALVPGYLREQISGVGGDSPA